MYGIPQDELAQQQHEAIEGLSLRKIIAGMPRAHRMRIVMLLHNLHDQIDAQGEYLSNATRQLELEGMMALTDHSPSDIIHPTYAGRMLQGAINSNQRMVNLLDFDWRMNDEPDN